MSKQTDWDDLREVVISSVRTAAVGHLPFEELGWDKENWKVEARIDAFSSRLVARITANLAHHKDTKEEVRGSVSYPADWWQAFKERWFPMWLLRICPVHRVSHSLTYVTINETRICPHIPMRTSDGPVSHLRFLVNGDLGTHGDARLPGLPGEGRRH